MTSKRRAWWLAAIVVLVIAFFTIDIVMLVAASLAVRPVAPPADAARIGVASDDTTDTGSITDSPPDMGHRRP
jgi:hypothetical protein